MLKFFKKIKKKVNCLIFNLAAAGVVLLLLSVLIIWTDFLFRLVFGVFVVVIAYVCFYLAYKVWALKREVEKYFKL